MITNIPTIIGSYTYTKTYKNIPAEVQVVFKNHVFDSASITGGRPLLESELYFDLEEQKGKVNREDSHTRHIKGDVLIRRYLCKFHFLNRWLNPDSDLKKQADDYAEELFTKYKDQYSASANLFVGKAKENEGAGELMKILDSLPWHQNKSFTQKFSSPEICAFLKQTPELQRMTVNHQGTVLLNVKNWDEMCFLYENTLIDYRVRTKDGKHDEKIIKEAREQFDALYPLATKTLREKADADWKQLLKKRGQWIENFLVK